MPYGFWIRNNNNRVVIDDESYTLQVLRTGTLSTGWSTHISNPVAGTSYRLLFNRQDPNSLVFFRGTFGKGVTQPMAMPWVSAGSEWILSNNTDSIDFVEVVPSNYFSRSTGSYGFEVYDSAGKLTFTTSRDLVSRNAYRVYEGQEAQTGYNKPNINWTDSSPWWCPLEGHGYQRTTIEILNNRYADNFYSFGVTRVNSTTYTNTWICHRDIRGQNNHTARNYWRRCRFITAKGI